MLQMRNEGTERFSILHEVSHLEGVEKGFESRLSVSKSISLTTALEPVDSHRYPVAESVDGPSQD